MTSPSTTMSFGGAPGGPATGGCRHDDLHGRLTGHPDVDHRVSDLNPIPGTEGDGVVQAVPVDDRSVRRPEILDGEAVPGGREAGVAARDVGVLIEHDVGGAGVATDHELLTHGPFGARVLAGDDDQDRERRDLLVPGDLLRNGHGRRSRLRRVGRQAPNLHDRGAELDPVAGVKLARAGHTLPVDEGAVGRAEILHRDAAVTRRERRVPRGDLRIGDYDVGCGVAADQNRANDRELTSGVLPLDDHQGEVRHRAILVESRCQVKARRGASCGQRNCSDRVG